MQFSPVVSPKAGMGWVTKEFGFNFRQERDISVFSAAFRRVLEFIQFSAPCVMGTPLPGMKWPRCDSDNTPQCSRKIMNMWSQTFTRYNFSSWCQIKHRDNTAITLNT